VKPAGSSNPALLSTASSVMVAAIDADGSSMAANGSSGGSTPAKGSG
jgi:hypothetical protein